MLTFNRHNWQEISVGNTAVKTSGICVQKSTTALTFTFTLLYCDSIECCYLLFIPFFFLTLSSSLSLCHYSLKQNRRVDLVTITSDDVYRDSCSRTPFNSSTRFTAGDGDEEPSSSCSSRSALYARSGSSSSTQSSSLHHSLPTDESPLHPALNKKKIVLITARVHPSETATSYVCQGKCLLQVLTIPSDFSSSSSSVRHFSTSFPDDINGLSRYISTTELCAGTRTWIMAEFGSRLLCSLDHKTGRRTFISFFRYWMTRLLLLLHHVLDYYTVSCSLN